MTKARTSPVRAGRSKGWRLLSLLAGLGGCSQKEADVLPVAYTGPLLETTNVRTLFSDSAQLKLQLTAPLEQQFENGDVLYPKGMVVTFYTDRGKTVLNTLSANYGKVDKQKNLYLMRGNVRVLNEPKQQKMNTEELFFDRNRQQIYTDSAMFVKVETPTETITGYGLTANQDFSRYRIKRPVGFFDKVGL